MHLHFWPTRELDFFLLPRLQWAPPSLTSTSAFDFCFDFEIQYIDLMIAFHAFGRLQNLEAWRRCLSSLVLVLRYLCLVGGETSTSRAILL